MRNDRVHRGMVTAVACAVLAVGLGACQQAADGGDPTPSEEVTTLEPSDAATTEAPDDGAHDPPTGDAEDRVSAAVADLADRQGVAATDIEAGPLEEVTWPNGALGCPDPQQSYTEALVAGTRLILTLDGEEYAYHGEASGPLTYCANPQPPIEADIETS